MNETQIQVKKDRFGWIWVLLDKKGWTLDAGATNTRWGAVREAKRAQKLLDRKPEVIL